MILYGCKVMMLCAAGAAVEKLARGEKATTCKDCATRSRQDCASDAADNLARLAAFSARQCKRIIRELLVIVHACAPVRCCGRRAAASVPARNPPLPARVSTPCGADAPSGILRRRRLCWKGREAGSRRPFPRRFPPSERADAVLLRPQSEERSSVDALTTTGYDFCPLAPLARSSHPYSTAPVQVVRHLRHRLVGELRQAAPRRPGRGRRGLRVAHCSPLRRRAPVGLRKGPRRRHQGRRRLDAHEVHLLPVGASSFEGKAGGGGAVPRWPSFRLSPSAAAPR
jgi:hypothetical protein